MNIRWCRWVASSVAGVRVVLEDSDSCLRFRVGRAPRCHQSRRLARAHTHARTHTYTHAPARAHTHTHTQTHTNTRARAHTHTHTLAHTHTHHWLMMPYRGLGLGRASGGRPPLWEAAQGGLVEGPSDDSSSRGRRRRPSRRRSRPPAVGHGATYLHNDTYLHNIPLILFGVVARRIPARPPVALCCAAACSGGVGGGETAGLTMDAAVSTTETRGGGGEKGASLYRDNRSAVRPDRIPLSHPMVPSVRPCHSCIRPAIPWFCPPSHAMDLPPPAPCSARSTCPHS